MIGGKIKKNIEYGQDHDSGITRVISGFSDKEEKVVIIDADSLLYIASYTGKHPETFEKLPEYTEEEYPIAEGLLTEFILSILSNIEEYFIITHCYICVKGKHNFRYKLLPDYKAKRPPSLPIINHLLEYLVKEHGALRSEGFEADDLCYSISELIDHQGIICTPDKDLAQIPTIIYNYNKNEWKRVSKEEACYNFAVQMIIGDPGDGVNLTPKHGIKYAEKVLRIGMCDFGYMREIITVFKKCWGSTWKENLLTAYNLLRLHKVDLPVAEGQKQVA